MSVDDCEKKPTGRHGGEFRAEGFGANVSSEKVRGRGTSVRNIVLWKTRQRLFFNLVHRTTSFN